MSRRSPRTRARFAATVEVAGLPHSLVCHTRDISPEGCFLDTTELVATGVDVVLAVMDAERGEAIQVHGVVTRCLPGGGGAPRGVGVRLSPPTPEWQVMVQRYLPVRRSEPNGKPVRLTVLVVGDEHQRRGALALYVTSGWDVRFAIDLTTAAEALGSVDLDAVIAEYQPSDWRATAVLEAARRLRPRARRLVRCRAGATGDASLIDGLVCREAGIEALIDALVQPTAGTIASAQGSA